MFSEWGMPLLSFSAFLVTLRTPLSSRDLSQKL